MLPRFLHRAYARLLGYFWLPCRGCGRMFGGHEASDYAIHDEDGTAWILCNRHDRDIAPGLSLGPGEYAHRLADGSWTTSRAVAS